MRLLPLFLAVLLSACQLVQVQLLSIGGIGTILNVSGDGVRYRVEITGSNHHIVITAGTRADLVVSAVNSIVVVEPGATICSCTISGSDSRVVDSLGDPLPCADTGLGNSVL